MNERDEALTKALAWLSGRGAEMEAALRELVEIASHTANAEGCTRAARAWAEQAMALGQGALVGGLRESASGRYGQHVSLGTEAARSGGAVVLVGHHDTVFPERTFAGFREDGALLRGPGVLDMKGGLVVMAYAMGALAEAGVLARLPLRAVSVADEEVGSPEGRELVLEAARGASCALVFESGRRGDRVVTQRKGTGGLTVTAHGRAAHAGNLHHEGRNAIWALARFIDRAQRLTDYDRGLTVNVGRVEGGIGKNTVPELAEALVDLRFIDAEAGVELVRALHHAAEDAARDVPGTRIELSGGIVRQPLRRTEASARLAAEYAACARAAGLGTAQSEHDADFEDGLIGGGSDANTCAELGVPAIDGLGPRGLGFHTTDEHIERASLAPKAAALTRFLVRRLP